MPRWRRPSVKAGRFGASVAMASTRRRLPLLFAGPPTADVERYAVRYDGVILLTEPDEVHGRRIQELDAKDEVEVLSHGAEWVHIRTPTGNQGWVPQMTVEPLEPWDVRRDEPLEVDEPAVGPSIGHDEEPSQLDSLLAAIVADRARAAEAAKVEVAPVVEPATGAPTEAVGPTVGAAAPAERANTTNTARRRRATTPVAAAAGDPSRPTRARLGRTATPDAG
jgi:hypothetical protein